MRIGIVGGGAAAVCVVDALAQSSHLRAELTVFDAAPQLWRGRAYQKDSDVILVNSPVEDMSVRDGDSGHYERWLAAHGHTDEFAPRATYGDYLEQSAHDAIARLRERRWRVTIVRENVTGARRDGERVELCTGEGPHAPFDHVVLAVGGGSPQDTYNLTGRPGFVGEPYPVSRTLAHIAPDDEVAVIGTGLTAVDVLLALESREHRGPITLLSRKGVLPAVRRRSVPHELAHFVPSRLHELAGAAKQVRFEDVVDLLATELAGAGTDLAEVWQEISCVGEEDAIARLRRQLGDTACTHMGMRVLQQAVHVCGPDLWPLLQEAVRRRVLAEHHRTLMSLCCPMPPSSARTLLRLVDAGTLTVLSGVRHVAATPDGFAVTTASRRLHVRHVINGVNASAHRVPLSARRLANALYDQRLAIPHPDGGLCVDTASSRLIGTSLANPGIYAIGDIAGGTFFFTFGIPSLVDRGRDIVADITAGSLVNG